ncbi:MAG: hypothetical protein AAGC64_09520 [Bacteroidota bacterium]
MRIYFFFSFLLPVFLSFTQTSKEVRLDEKIDEITYKWDLEADKLSSYEGLSNLCINEKYRFEIFNLLKEIHHHDSVLYKVLSKLSDRSKDKEIAITLRDIKKFEEEYNMKEFIHFLKRECKLLLEIERNINETKNEVGYTSYSSQVYMLETELYKYVKQITKSVDNIRRHVHHLSSHYQN